MTLAKFLFYWLDWLKISVSERNSVLAKDI